jgi:hypothetical protein
VVEFGAVVVDSGPVIEKGCCGVGTSGFRLFILSFAMAPEEVQLVAPVSRLFLCS